MSGARTLDVSELEPPEPMERILVEIEGLGAGEYLRVLHRREPWPLFPMLEQRGFAYSMGVCASPGFVILVWRAADEAAARAAHDAEA